MKKINVSGIKRKRVTELLPPQGILVDDSMWI